MTVSNSNESHLVEASSFDPVSPTAKVVEYLRSYGSDSKPDPASMYCLEGKQILDSLGVQCPECLSMLSVLFQSRFHAINVAILTGRESSQQVLEFGSGISDRGMQWSKHLHKVSYVESDLPRLIAYKQSILTNDFKANETRRGTWAAKAVNVLDEISVRKSLDAIDPVLPFAMVCEGLMLYFDSHEIERFIQVIKKILVDYPSACWITDVVTRENLAELGHCHVGAANAAKKVFSMTGRKVIEKNPFDTFDGFKNKMRQFGLRVESEVDLSMIAEKLTGQERFAQLPISKVVGTRKVVRIMLDG